jgi:hypothetical protein
VRSCPIQLLTKSPIFSKKRTGPSTIYGISKHCPQPDEADQDAAFVALTQAQKEKAHQNSIREMLDMFAKAYFLNGMKGALKVTVMNAKPTTLKAAIEKVMEAKQVIETANQVKNRISELAKMEDRDLEDLEDLDEDTICQINKSSLRATTFQKRTPIPKNWKWKWQWRPSLRKRK